MKWINQLPKHKIRFYGVIMASLILIFIRFVWPFVFNGYEQPVAVKGVMDLRQWDFQLKGNVKLRGDWTFVPNQFIPPSAFPTSSPEAKFIKVPHLWNPYFDDNKSTPLGFATYRLNILLPEKLDSTTSASVTYALHVTSIRSSHTLFVNGTALKNRGNPGEKYENTKPDNYPYIAFANITGNTAEIIVHVANFANKTGGGIILPIEFGTPVKILAAKRLSDFSDTTIIILFLLLSILCGFLYSYQPKQSHMLYFALLCLSAALYIATSNEKLLLLISALSYNTYIKMQALSTVGFIFYSYMFIVRMYPELMKSSSHWIIRIAIGCFAGLFLFTNPPIFSVLLPMWFVFFSALIIYSLGLLFKAVLAHRKDAPFLFLAAIGLLCHGSSYIMLNYAIVIHVGPPIDLMVFALSLMLIVANRFVETMDQVKSLSLQQVRMEMAFMQAQIKPHFLFNSLNTIGSFIETEPYRAQDLLGEFSTYLRFGFDLTNLEPTVPFDREWMLVEAYLKLEQARYGDALNIYVDVAHARGVRLPPLTLQPLVENAVRHGVMRQSEGGSIRITAKVIENQVEIIVADTGVGISPERLATLLINPTSYEPPLPSNGNGIGLKNIQHRLIHTYGTGLLISSNLEQGTIIKFRIPIEAAKEDDLKNTFG